MTPEIATAVCGSGILGLFALDRERNSRTSKALWLPIIWLSVASSRMVSQWLAVVGLADPTSASTGRELLEGSPLDRFVLTVLLTLGGIVLIRRGKSAIALLRANIPILLFFLYCALSVLWSDYPDVAFKRWTKAVGDMVMVAVVLTDPDRPSAIKRLIVTVGFVLVPLSILMIKYYPAVGRGFSRWALSSYNIGVATSKNELGGICLLFGLGSVWCVLRILRSAAGGRTRRLLAHAVFLAMVLWLYWKSNAMTSLACFAMGTALLILTSLRAFRRPFVVTLLMLGMLSVSFAALFLNIGGDLVGAMNRDSTLTGRVGVWGAVLNVAANPLVGTGFESFWLGARLETIWSLYWWHPNEAHNGYLETYLNLGWIGIALLALVILSAYRNAIASCREPDTGCLRIAYFVIALIYNFTESAIRIMHPIWICFLLAATTLPQGRLMIKKAAMTRERCNVPSVRVNS